MGIWKPILILCAVGLLGACGYAGISAPVEGRAHVENSPRDRHLVRRGDTLYAIAWQYDRDYRVLAAWNGIREPYVIYPGQYLRLKPPARGDKRRAAVDTVREIPVTPARKTVSKPLKKRPAVATTRATAEIPPERKVASGRYKGTLERQPLRWRWPTRGEIMRRFSDKGNKGIDIGGRFGQPVVAAAAGRVVYSGSGLIGYGKLIIIKHNKSHLSAYAHNDHLLVAEGDLVAGGQGIARMGRAVSKETVLHFEIRLNGKPVDPLRYLPKLHGAG